MGFNERRNDRGFSRTGGRSGGSKFGGNRSGGNRSGGSKFGGGRFGGNRGGNRSGGFRNDNFSRGPKELHNAICAECKKECQVPFKPTGERPVYCRECFAKHKPQY